MPVPTVDHLRRYAIARSLFKPTTLPAAIKKLGFVQADPMRAPARAQDLILRLRVADYKAGDLEQRYTRLQIEEDCFVNYGFVPRDWLALMHPRSERKPWDAERTMHAQQLLDFVRSHGPTHPKQLLEAFAHHGRMPGYWGGELNVSPSCSTACTTAASCASSGATAALASTRPSSIRRPTTARPRERPAPKR